MIGMFFGAGTFPAGFGTLFGGSVGFMMGGPLGAMFGAAFGQNFDRGIEALGSEASPQAQAQAAFLVTTFAVMGAVAKADGRVSEAEIAFARGMMERLGLDPAQRRAAIACFTQGKSPEFPLDATLASFARSCQPWPTLARSCIEMQFATAWADGEPAAAALALIARVAAQLGLSPAEHAEIERRARAHHRPEAEPEAEEALPHTPPGTLAAAYAELGVAMDASDAEVTRAYRLLLSRHHPDKLVGAAETVLKRAAERTHAVVSAYERIRAARTSAAA